MTLKRTFLAIAAVVLCLAGYSAVPASALPRLSPNGLEAADAASPALLTVSSRGGHGRHYGGNRYYRPHYNGRRYYGGHRHYGYRHHRYNHYNNWGYWNRRDYGPRCRTWTSYCRNYYRGWYYANPWWGMPMIGAGVVISGGGNRHVAWCEGRYRSYNPRNNTWISNSGKVRQCISPYGP